LGSGELLFDSEILERIRGMGAHISQVCLVDKKYRQPSMTTRRALREFADWQRASAHLDKEMPAGIFAFGHIEDFCAALGDIAGSHVIIHCDAHWENFLDECETAALRGLEPQGLFARLNPQHLLGLVGDSGLLEQEATLRHSRAPFSVAAWILAPGPSPSLQQLADFSLEACAAAIASANAEPPSEMVAARQRAQEDKKAQALLKSQELQAKNRQQEIIRRAQSVSQAPSQGCDPAEHLKILVAKRDLIVKERVERIDAGLVTQDQDAIRKSELQKLGYTVWHVVFDPQVAVRALPRVSAQRVGVLFKGEEVVCSNDTMLHERDNSGWIQIVDAPARAQLPPEAWVCFDAGKGEHGLMLEQVHLGSVSANTVPPQPPCAPAAA
jgi:hypothetical protein